MQRQLENAYRFYNRKFFNKELPAVKDITLRWHEIRGSTMGYATDEEIVLSTKYKDLTKLWKLTLLHEMAHVKVGYKAGHGPKFNNEMLRLARAGAFDGLW